MYAKQKILVYYTFCLQIYLKNSKNHNYYLNQSGSLIFKDIKLVRSA